MSGDFAHSKAQGIKAQGFASSQTGRGSCCDIRKAPFWTGHLFYSSTDSPADAAQPDWWTLAKAHKHKLTLLAAEENGGDSDGGSYFASPALEATTVGVWSSPFVEGPKRPPPRYEHAAATVGPNLYVLGGNCGASSKPACPCLISFVFVVALFCSLSWSQAIYNIETLEI